MIKTNQRFFTSYCLGIPREDFCNVFFASIFLHISVKHSKITATARPNHTEEKLMSNVKHKIINEANDVKTDNDRSVCITIKLLSQIDKRISLY